MYALGPGFSQCQFWGQRAGRGYRQQRRGWTCRSTGSTSSSLPLRPLPTSSQTYNLTRRPSSRTRTETAKGIFYCQFGMQRSVRRSGLVVAPAKPLNSAGFHSHQATKQHPSSFIHHQLHISSLILALILTKSVESEASILGPSRVRYIHTDRVVQLLEFCLLTYLAPGSLRHSHVDPRPPLSSTRTYRQPPLHQRSTTSIPVSSTSSNDKPPSQSP